MIFTAAAAAQTAAAAAVASIINIIQPVLHIDALNNSEACNTQHSEQHIAGQIAARYIC